MSFSGDINKFNLKVENRSSGFLRALALQMFSNIVLLTPVDTGRARGNWQIEINKLPANVLKATDKSGSKSSRKATGKLKKAKIGDRIFIANNLPYIQKLENGSSLQAPSGMVKVTASQFKRYVKQSLSKAKKTK